MDGIQVIARAALILRALKEAQSGLSLGQIAERVGLPRSTVQRIVAALVDERLLMTSGRTGGVRLGPELQALAAAARHNTVDLCHAHLTALAAQTGETVDLSVLREAGMIFLDQVPGTHRLRTISSVGEVFPLTTTANGRAALALLPPEKALRLAGDEWARRGSAPQPGFAAMLDQIRERGLALDRDEHTDGISAVGAAFLDHAGEIHAISVPIPSSRFAGMQARVEQAVTAAVVQIGRMLHGAG